MKTRNLKITAIVLILAGCFSSCSSKMDDENIPVSDPETAILGKWELVLMTRHEGRDEHKHTPKGYVEYLPDGRLGWYDYTTKEYTLFKQKYWLDKSYEYPSDAGMDNDWILYYEYKMIEGKDVYGEPVEVNDCPDYPDKPNRTSSNQFLLKFKNQNTISLYTLDLYFVIADFEYFYKRIK